MESAPIFDVLIRALADSAEAITGERPEVESEPASGPGEQAAIWRHGFATNPGAVWIVLEGAPLVNPVTALDAFASELTRVVGRQIKTAEAEQASQAPAEVRWVRLNLRFSGAAAAEIFAGLDDELISGLAPAAPADAAGTPKTLDLLMDVELPVSISFGRAQVPLKDVLKLSTGSIVELNRAIAEPVEVIVNNCVIARGEVVVVEGNFGVKIQQVISRQERLRTLN